MSSSDPTPREQAERLLFHFLREVPHLPSARDLAAASSPVSPWPHQLRVIRRTADRYPQSFLLSDEVGLGKTVEAALILRRLWISGRVRRGLILVPKAVLRQWQEELHEKAALEVPIFVGDRFLGLDGRELEPERRDPNPWNRQPLVLASTQLARSRKRSAELRRADPWDLVVVDEAHHARRRRAGVDGERRANRLLDLLAHGLAPRTQCLYLLTATPMQIHPVEVWDLLKLLGLGGEWGAREDAFVGYFEQLQRPFESRDWPLVLRLAADASLEENSAETSSGGSAVDDAEAREILERVRRGDPVGAVEQALALGEAGRRGLDRFLRRSTPVRSMVWRHTRPLLREYHRRGLLDTGVPERRPQNVWIELSPAERRLYDRIEDYLSRFYQRYEARRSGLGFVMTVYRRRLTSSFYAVRRSLARRLELLRGHRSSPVPEWAEAESEADDLDLPWVDELEEGAGQIELFGVDSPTSDTDGTEIEDGTLPSTSRLSTDEIQYLESFLEALERLPEDSKLQRLLADLERLSADHDRVLVFTQYLDTLDYVRDALRELYTVACYSGRGGEILEGDRWIDCGKEELKRRFGAGEIRVLLCTEAAGEGLNFQTCGALVHYDMPWNPMRVEQRIGRIDRIGQRHKEITVLSYFYADTVEAVVYQRLAHRIDWFQAVLGELQPILHRVGETLQDLALTPASRRSAGLEKSLRQLESDLDHRPPDVLAPGPETDAILELADATLEHKEPVHHPAPPRELERIFLESDAWGEHFQAEEGDEGVYRLLLDGVEHRVTFRPELFAERPYSLRLLTWGDARFERMVGAVPPPAWRAEPQGIGWYRTSRPAPVSLFLLPADGAASVVDDLADLRARIEEPAPPWTRPMEGAASSMFSRARRQVLEGRAQVEAERRRAEVRALRAASSDVLRRAAWIELARARNPGLFDDPVDFGFGVEAVAAQARHGPPFDRLLESLGADPPAAEADDPRYLELVGRSPEALERLWVALVAEAEALVKRREALEKADRAARREQREAGLSGLLERQYCVVAEPAASADGESASVEVPLEDLRPFDNAVPFFESPDEAALFLDPEDGQGLEILSAEPESCRWVRPEGRRLPGPGLFVCGIPDDSLEPRVPAGGRVLLRAEARPPRAGDLVLGIHPRIRSETAGDAAILGWSLEQDPDGSQRLLLLRGDGTAALVLEDEEPADLRVLATVVEVLA